MTASVMVLSTACALPLVVRTSGVRTSSDAPLTVTLDRELELAESAVRFRLTFLNDGDDDLIVHLPSITAGSGTTRSKVVRDKPQGESVFFLMPSRSILDGLFRLEGVLKEPALPENFAVVLRHSQTEVTLRAPLPGADELDVRFDDAVFGLDGSVYALPPLSLVSRALPVEEARPSRLHIGARVMAGVLLGPIRPAPLNPTAQLVTAFTGFFEGFIGWWSRAVEVHVVLRPGMGRVVAMEAGARPFVEWLTFLVNYGFDAFQPQGVEGLTDPLLGHGPRLTVEAAFDVDQRVLGLSRPKRFGAFVTSGWSWLPNTFNGRTVIVPVIEGGLRMRLH
jgi:hypothetical protein